MSTRCTIWKKEDDKLRGVYCHNDGYLSGVGACLYANYTNKEKVNKLIYGGGISSLGTQIEKFGADKKVPFDYSERLLTDKSQTVFYARDRGDDLSIYEASDISEARNNFGEEFDYFFINGVWFWLNGGELVELTPELILKEWSGVGYIDLDFARLMLEKTIKGVLK